MGLTHDLYADPRALRRQRMRLSPVRPHVRTVGAGLGIIEIIVGRVIGIGPVS
jgi:hypothetical protein